MRTRKYFNIFVYKSFANAFSFQALSRYWQTLFLGAGTLLFVKTLFSNILGHNDL